MSETLEITPIQRLALASAGGRRDAAQAIFALDNECARIVRMANEPLMAQIRLAWWRDGLTAKDVTPEHRSRAMEELRGLAGFDAVRNPLVAIINGWEELLVADGEEWRTMLPGYAQGRGGGLFAALSGGETAVAASGGRLWALWDLAGNIADERLAMDTIEEGRRLAEDIRKQDLRELPRMVQMLALPALGDLRKGLGAPRRLDLRLYLKLLRIQLLGR